MVETIKTDVECLLKIKKGLIFTSPYDDGAEIDWYDLVIEKEGDNIRIISEDCDLDELDERKSLSYLELSELAIREYFEVEKVTGLQIVQYVKEQSKRLKYDVAEDLSISKTWSELYIFWDLLQHYADAIFLAEAYHSIRMETRFFENFTKKVMKVMAH